MTLEHFLDTYSAAGLSLEEIAEYATELEYDDAFSPEGDLCRQAELVLETLEQFSGMLTDAGFDLD